MARIKIKEVNLLSAECALNGSKTMKFQAIEANRDQVKVRNACQILGDSRSGYYAWRDRKPVHVSNAKPI